MAKTRHDGRSEWDVKHEAGQAFERQNPPPKKAARPEKLEPMPAGLVPHAGQGGMWLILSERDTYGHRAGPPATELTIVLGDHVTQVLLPLRHLEALQMEVTRALDDHRLAQQRWQAGVDMDAAYEDALRDWNAAKETFQEQAAHTWKHGSAEKVEPGQATVTGEMKPPANEGNQGDAVHS